MSNYKTDIFRTLSDCGGVFCLCRMEYVKASPGVQEERRTKDGISGCRELLQTW